MSSHQILIHPAKPAVIAGMAQKVTVLLRVQAPDAPPEAQKPRRPYHLSLVIDRSGSMSGAPLLEAVRCATHVIGRLAPTDVASLVVFDDHVRTLAPAQPVGDRRALEVALAQVRPGGSTNLHGGWKAGADMLLPNAAEASISRVILLSDGNANVGETTSASEIAALCAEAAAQGVSTSTYGLGHNFNEDLMVAMAKDSGGNNYYGDTAADLMEPFAEEFDLISNLFARSVRLSLAAPPGVKMRVLNQYRLEERDGFPVIQLPDVAYGAEAWALIELEIPAELAGESGEAILQAAVTALSPGGEPVAFHDAKLALPPMPPAAWEALVEDPLVVTRRTELAAGAFLDRARSLAEHGDWNAITPMIEEAKQRFGDHPWVLEVLNGLAELAEARDQARFRKEALFSSSRINSRLSAKEERLSPDEDARMMSFLRRKGRQGKAGRPNGGDTQD